MWIQWLFSYIQYVKSVELSEINLPTWTWLGRALSRNRHITELTIIRCNVDWVAVGDGLQSNQSIQKLNLTRNDLRGNAMSSLAPSIRQIPYLTELSFSVCRLGSAEINILSEALLGRSEDTLEVLNLGHNRFGDIDLDELVLALTGLRTLSAVSLMYNEIGPRGCYSISKLLENRESNLKQKHLDDNLIDDEYVTTFADALAKNTKLTELALGLNDDITTVGWLALLKLVSDGSSINGVIKSNHTLQSLGLYCDTSHTGFDDYNLLHLANIHRQISNAKPNASHINAMWTRVKCVKQCELECGCRMILHFYIAASCANVTEFEEKIATLDDFEDLPSLVRKCSAD